MNIEHACTPAAADIDFLTQKINQETPDFGSAHPFVNGGIKAQINGAGFTQHYSPIHG